MIRGLYAASMVTLLASASVGLKWAQEGVEFLIETARKKAGRKKAGRKKTARKATRKKSARKVSRKKLTRRPSQVTRTQGSAASKATTAREPEQRRKQEPEDRQQRDLEQHPERDQAQRR